MPKYPVNGWQRPASPLYRLTSQIFFSASAPFLPHPLPSLSSFTVSLTLVFTLFPGLVWLFPSSFTSFISPLLPHPFWLPPYFRLVILSNCHLSVSASLLSPMFPALLFYLNPLLTHTSSLLLQSGGSRLPASAAGGPGGERANGDPGGEGGDMAGGVPTHQNPDQRGADHHPPGAAGPRGHRTSGYGEDAGGRG